MLEIKLLGFHWPNYSCKNDWWGMSPSTRKFEGYWPTRRFSIYFRP